MYCCLRFVQLAACMIDGLRLCNRPTDAAKELETRKKCGTKLCAVDAQIVLACTAAHGLPRLAS